MTPDEYAEVLEGAASDLEDYTSDPQCKCSTCEDNRKPIAHLRTLAKALREAKPTGAYLAATKRLPAEHEFTLFLPQP